MNPLPELFNEQERVRALAAYQILDTPPEADFDDLTSLAVTVLQAPIALVVLVDQERQWFKSRVGLNVCQTPREQAFCAYTILQPEALIVEDARHDPRFAQNPLVLGEPFIRFYAGIRLVAHDGHALGSLCVIDHAPRRFGPESLLRLEQLGRQAERLLELRRVTAQLHRVTQQAQQLTGLVPMCSYCNQVRDDGGAWQRVETYVAERSQLRFSHGICPGCADVHFPGAPAAPGTSVPRCTRDRA